MTQVLDPAEVAEAFRKEIRAEVSTLSEPLVLVGLLASDHGPSHTYAEYTRKACEDVGVRFQLRHVTRLDAERVIHEANEDPAVHGVLVYYPIFGTEQDAYLRDSVSLSKDIEGLHSFWARSMYENRRFVDAAKTKKAILPCTPLAILKLVEAAGRASGWVGEGDGASASGGVPLHGSAVPSRELLAGRTVCIFNRSEVVGRPLASMMAHDGARVISFDVDGPLLFVPGKTADAHHEVLETDVDRQRALAQADIVVTGVPSRDFERVRADEIRPGALCINFSTYKNFSEDIVGKAGVFVPRVGPMTVTMALRNTLRLYRNVRS